VRLGAKCIVHSSTIMQIFIHLQEKRHEADYDPFARFLRSDVEEVIEFAETAISLIDKRNLDRMNRRAFAAWVLFRKPRQ